LIINFNTVKIKIELTCDELKLFNVESDYLDGISKNIKSSFFEGAKKVNDKWRYNLSFSGERWNLNTLEHDKTICNKKNNIIIILESPHREEYDEYFNPLGPAKGATGIAFTNYFLSHALPILKSLGMLLKNDKEYCVCFVNPVQHQTSLYEIHKKGLNSDLRDKVWKALYPNCKIDFRKRLKSYKPKFIINACTSKLKRDLDEELNMVVSEKFETPHPSSWNRIFSPFKKYNKTN